MSAYRDASVQLYFWRTRAGLEVDFVLYGQDSFYALEVKNTATLRSSMLNALRAFRQKYPEAKTGLLYRGQEQVLIDDVCCIPTADFLSRLHPDSALPYLDLD